MGKKSKRKRHINRVRMHCPMYSQIAYQAASVGRFISRKRRGRKDRYTQYSGHREQQQTIYTQTIKHEKTEWEFI